MKVAIYVRVSTQRQAQTQTIEQQLDLLRAHSQTHEWPWQDDHIFRDDGYSGASLRRPGLDRLRDQVSGAVFDRVVLTAPDRLARNYAYQFLLVQELEDAGVTIVTVDIAPFLAAGKLRVVVDRVFKLHEAAAAHDYIEGGQAIGKIALSIA